MRGEAERAAGRQGRSAGGGRLALVTGAIVFALGAVALAGHLFDAPGLTRLLGGEHPVTPAGAVGILALGLALLLLAVDQRLAAFIKTVVVLGVAIGGGIRLFDTGPGGVTVFALTGLGLAVLAADGITQRARVGAAVLGGLAVVFGLAAAWALGVSPVPPTGWPSVFDVPPLLAVAALLAGAGTIGVAWRRERQQMGRAPSWLSVAIAMAGLALTAILTTAIASYEAVLLDRQISAHAHGVRERVESMLTELRWDLERAAARWERPEDPDLTRWRTEAQWFLNHARPVDAVLWIGPDGAVRASVGEPLAGVDGDVLADGLEAARRRDATLITPVLRSPGDAPTMAVITPMRRPGGTGFLVAFFSPEALFAPILNWSTAAGLALSLGLPGGPVLQNDVARLQPAPEHQEQALVSGALVSVDVGAGPGLHVTAGGLLSAAGLVAGLIASVLLGAVVYLYGSTRRRAAGTARANQDLRREVRDRKRAEAELRMSEARFRAVFDNAAIALVRIDPEVKILEANRAAEEMLRMPPGSLTGRDARDFSPIEDIARERRPWAELLAGRRSSYQLEKRYLRSDWSIMWGRVTASLVMDDEGRPLFAIGMIEDVTARKRAESEQREAMRRLEESNLELERFASVVAHDLQEPLLTIRMFGQYLEEEAADRLDEEGRDFVSRIRRAADHMQLLIQSLLALSRVTTRGRPFEPVDLGEVLDDIRADLRGRLEESGGVIEAHDLPTVTGDPAQLRQLFLNLVGNALKYRKPDVPPRVRVTSHAENGHQRVSVQDNGTGFDPKDRGKLFQPFQRLHDPKRYAGTGIGLPICKRIVERHGGRIEADARPGSGATFTFTLPAARPEPPPEEAAKGNGSPATGSPGPPRASSR